MFYLLNHVPEIISDQKSSVRAASTAGKLNAIRSILIFEFNDIKCNDSDHETVDTVISTTTPYSLMTMVAIPQVSYYERYVIKPLNNNSLNASLLITFIDQSSVNRNCLSR